MTTPLPPEWDPALSAALDRFSVPEPRADWMAGIASAAKTRRTPMFGRIWPTHARRTGWARRGFVTSAMSISLLSATAAAAAGWFGNTAMQLPVISMLAQAIPDAVKPVKLGRTEHHSKRSKTINASAESSTDIVIAPLPEIDFDALRREARAEHIANRLETEMARRDARRKARGLPPVPQQERALLTAFRAAKTDAERLAVLDRVRAIRAQRLEKMERIRPQHPNRLQLTERHPQQIYRETPAKDADAIPEKRIKRLQTACAAMAPNRPIPRICRRLMEHLPIKDQSLTETASQTAETVVQ
ncbi:MAG: hypothetical protein ABL918_07805 [Chakrabartia sp.]